MTKSLWIWVVLVAFGLSTPMPSLIPTLLPSTQSPSESPIPSPTHSTPSESPTQSPSESPTQSPTLSPTQSPTFPTTHQPSFLPTSKPTRSPTPPTTRNPTKSPSTSKPTTVPTTSKPSSVPTKSPSRSPSTSKPTKSPSTSKPTKVPTTRPSRVPTNLPTKTPSRSPSTSKPTKSPSTSKPTKVPTTRPSRVPTNLPTESPSQSLPTRNPTWSLPTATPTWSLPTSTPTQSLPTSTPSQSPTTSVPTVSPSVAPTRSPTMLPTSSPTLHVPELVQAIVSNDLTRIHAMFDSNTNKAKSGRQVCSSMVTLEFATQQEQDSGCAGGSKCDLFCSWNSPQHLVIELNPKSNFQHVPLRIVLSSAFGIRHFTNVLPNLHFNASVFPPESAVVPTLALSGPKVQSLCGKPVQLTTFSSGSGGRSFVFEWRANNITIVNATTGSTYSPPMPALASNVTYSAMVKNWAGQTAFATHTVQFKLEAVASVVLSVGASVRVKANANLKVQPQVSFPSECIPIGKSQSDIVYTYLWKVFDQEMLVGQRSDSVFRLNPVTSALIPKPTHYKLVLFVDTGLGIFGQAETTVFVDVLPFVVAKLTSSSKFSVEQNQSVVLSASRSCDPNRALPLCDSNTGQFANNHSGLLFSWHCYSSTQNCQNVCRDQFGPECVVDALALMGGNDYVFFANVSSVSSGYFSVTPDILVSVLSQLPRTCVRPQIQMLPFPAKINAQSSGEAPLQARIFSSDSSSLALTWQDTTSPVVLSTQPQLVLPLNTLVAGSTYTFRLTASLPCTLGSDAFGEITFSMNSPPLGGALTVFPLEGEAALTSFVLTGNGFSDEDLPLEYMFESVIGGGGGISPLSSFQSSSVLTTQFAVSPRLGVRCIARDALGASTTREASPFVDFIVVHPLVLNLDFDPDTEIDKIQKEGGSDEDALRFAQALAASTAGSASSNGADPQVTEWLLDSQTSLLNLVGQSRQGSSADPSLILLQSSALGSILQGSVGLQDTSTVEGASFLSQATNTVALLLEDAKQAILQKGQGGESDPLLSQHIPADLGQVTLDSLQSLLRSIQVSTLNINDDSRRRRRRLEQQEQGIANLRTRLQELVEILLLGSVDGSPPKVIPGGTEMKVVAVKMNPRNDQTLDVLVPAFEDDDLPTVFSIPAFVHNDTSSLLNVQAVRFRFNVRELVQQGAINYTLDEHSPANNVSEILALDFFTPNRDQLHPHSLDIPITINLSLSYANVPKDNTTQLSCGAWNEQVGGWSSFGCNVTQFRLPTNEFELGWQLCSCNHASDYAVWQSFVRDLGQVFVPIDLTTLTLISSLMIGILLPVLVLAWGLGCFFSKAKDRRDLHLVHLGTFVSVTRKKIELNERQRRFFKLLRDNKESCKEDLNKLKETNNPTTTDNDNAEYTLALVNNTLRFLGVCCLASACLSLASLLVPTFANDAPMPGNDDTILGLTVTYIVFQLCSLGMCCAGPRWRSLGTLVSFQFLLVLPIGLSALSLPFTTTLGGVYTINTGLGLLMAGGFLSLVTCACSFAVYGFQQNRGSEVWRHFVQNVGKGLVYEQSLVSLVTRYDPYFDRLQRVSIVMAVVLGNLFATSFFFGIKTGQEASVGLMFGTIVLASILVAVPVKLGIRFLFRITASRVGSPEDRVAQIFRIIAFSNDIVPGFAHKAALLDTEMLTSFKRFYLAEEKVKLIEKMVQNQRVLEEDRLRLERGLPPKFTHEFWLLYAVWFNALMLLLVGLLQIVFAVVLGSQFELGLAIPIIFFSWFTAICIALVSTIPRFKLTLSVWLFRIVLPLGNALPVILLGVLLSNNETHDVVVAAMCFSILGLVSCLYSLFVYLARDPKHFRIQRFPRASITARQVEEEQEGERVETRQQQQQQSVLVSRLTGEMSLDNPLQSPPPPHRSTLSILDQQLAHHSQRFQKSSTLGVQLTHHPMLLNAVDPVTQHVLPSALEEAKENRAQCRSQLKQVIRQSKQAWAEMSIHKLSARQEAVRKEGALMLKLATVLAEEPRTRPRMVKKLFPARFIYASWFCLSVYYVGCLAWICSWILTRDQVSFAILEARLMRTPTNEEVSVETNTILAAWLVGSFLAIFVGYFVAEPVVIIVRYGFLPAIMELSHKKVVPLTEKELVELELRTIQAKEKELAEEALQEGGSTRKAVLKPSRFATDGAFIANTLDLACEVVESIA